jgi:hypothetical protein
VWLAIAATLSLMGGWHGEIGWGVFPVSYGACLFVTVGPKAFSLSVLFIFRFLHPRLVIPWSAVERCERVKYWLMNRVAIYVEGFDRRILFPGVVGERILGAWTESRDKGRVV